jgi:hypothetical protein
MHLIKEKKCVAMTHERGRFIFNLISDFIINKISGVK